MVKRTKSKDTAPVYKIERAKGGTQAVAKIVIPRIAVNDLHDNVESVMEAIRKEGKTFNVVRGVLRLF